MTTTNLKHRAPIAALEQDLNGLVFERESEIRAVVTALIAREHVFIGGPPGTAKSLMVQLTNCALTGNYFEWLLTKFSTPEELFGPVSMKGMRNDTFERVVDGKLPTAQFAFLDECFKASSAILNALLTLLNERKFDNGTSRHACPLELCIGASNELPQGEELEALFDRFLFRFWVGGIQDRDKLGEMIAADDAVVTAKVSASELEAARKEAAAIPIPKDVLELLLDIKALLEAQGYHASDRRWKKAYRALRAFAFVSGHDTVKREHLMILVDILWREPKDRDALLTLIAEQANPLATLITKTLDAAREEFRRLPTNGDNGMSKDEKLSLGAEVLAALKDQMTKLTDEAGDTPNDDVDNAKTEIRKLHERAGKWLGKLAGVSL